MWIIFKTVKPPRPNPGRKEKNNVSKNQTHSSY